MRALLGTGLAAGGAVAAVALRAAARRGRPSPDPERPEPLAERPGPGRRVRSFDGTSLAVHVAGPAETGARAPALVFAHGFSLDLTAWHYQWRHFSLRHRCVLFDQRGHGASSRAGQGGYSVEALGRDLQAILEAEVPEGPVVLVGHSMGGMGVLALAAQRPEWFGPRVRAVVLANTAAGDILREVLGGLGARLGAFFIPAPRHLAVHPQRLHGLRARVMERSPGLAQAATRMVSFGRQAPPAVVEHVAGLAASVPADVWTRLVVSLSELELGHALEHVTAPALVVAGDRDRLTPPASALALERRLPDARMAVFAGAGHCTMLERPDEFNRAVEDFLGLLPAGGAA